MTTDGRQEVEAAARALMHGRYDQAFPVLTEAELARVRRYGRPVRFTDGQALFEVGRPRAGMFVLLSGRIAVSARDGLGRVTPVVDQGPGQFVAEVGTLADGATSNADGRAMGEVEALLVPPDRLRALVVEEAELGERLMRALILRRMALIDLGEGGALVVGPAGSAGVARLEDFLRRNGQPHRIVDPAVDRAGAEVLERLAPPPSALPLVVCPNGEILRNPSDAELARALGVLPNRLFRDSYDVAIVGCGPAGLSAAVYAASEGLSVVVLESHAFGGQAGASTRIENYFGFPTGITGLALTARAFVQARKFGAEVLLPVEVTQLDCACRDDRLFGLVLDDGRRVRARSVVIATGARYRRPAIENLAAFEGRGVWYWASPYEARLCAGQEVFLVGGGNSAGQAAVYLAGHAAKVRMMVRGQGLSATMSTYLAERIAATPNIEVLPGTQIVGLEGSPDVGLVRVRWQTRGAGETVAPAANVFIFVGADPATRWLTGCGVALDAHGFVLTGAGASALESSMPGVFAIGDVRAGSVKRVGSAIGEGAQVVAALHAFLAPRATVPVA